MQLLLRRRCGRLVLSAWLALATTCAPCLSRIPNQVQVTLFVAQAPIAEATLFGPLAVQEPHRILPAGMYKVVAERNSVALHVGGKPILTTTAALKLVGLSKRGLHVRVPSRTPILLNPSNQLDRYYRGKVEFRARAGKLAIVNTVAARHYVVSVVGSETNPNCPLEALKAQSVLCQTRLSRYHPGDNLSDTTEVEAYLGSAHERAEVDQAVWLTWGQTLTWQSRPVTVFYHSTCAGGTSAANQYFHLKPGELPYLPAVACSYCKASPFFQPTIRTIPWTAFNHAFHLPTSNIAGPTIKTRDSAGRALSVQVGHGRIMSGYQFWLTMGQKLGWDRVPGTRYEFVAAAPAGHMRIKSTGAGHGVGLCQWGAAEMAKQGKTFDQILDYYYPAARLH